MAKAVYKRNKTETLKSFVKNSFNKVSTLLLALVLFILVPMLPVLIEWAKTNSVKNDNYLITASVLAASLGVSAEHDFYRAGYSIIFLVTITLYGLVVGGPIASGVDRYAWVLLLAVAILHASERFWWHIVLSRSLTDTFKKAEDSDDA